MDIGSLMAKRQTLRIWIITPILVILLLGVSSRAFRNYKVNVLAEQERLYRIIPQMEQTLAAAEKVLLEFGTHAQQGLGAGDELLASAHKAAEKQKFNLTSAAVEMNRIKADIPLVELETALLGNGSLSSIIQFMNALMSEQRLLSEKEFQLVLMPDQQGNYSTKIICSRIALQNGNTSNE